VTVKINSLQHFVINPNSGKMTLSKKRNLVSRSAKGKKAKISIPSSPEQSSQIAKEAMMAGEIVVACGGDGLQNIVAQQAVTTGGTMAVLPLGRGNDFASSLKINSIQDAKLALAGQSIHEARYIVAEFSNHSKIALTCAGVGLLSEAAFRAAKIPLLKGRILYSVAALLCFIDLKCHEYALDLDGVESKSRNLILAAAASEYTGGGIFIAPSARSEPSMLNVLSAGAVTRRTAVNLLNKAMHGTHLAHPKVENRYCSICNLESDATNSWSKLVYGDGEFLGTLPVKLSLGKKPLRVLTPTDV